LLVLVLVLLLVLMLVFLQLQMCNDTCLAAILCLQVAQ
jgi:hypothetical protein